MESVHFKYTGEFYEGQWCRSSLSRAGVLMAQRADVTGHALTEATCAAQPHF